jgi:bacterioferritin-associated ferredoxin
MTDTTICYCIGVTEDRIVQAIREGARTLKDIQRVTKACTGNHCKDKNPKGRCCSEDILAIIKRETGAASSSNCSCCKGSPHPKRETK